MHKRMTLLALITVLVLLLVAQGVLVAADFAAGTETAVSNSTIARPHDPVVMTGSQLSVLQGTAVTDLVLYAYVTST
ncbi:MAG: hypothetical protein KC413_21945, partial [Anaerolineales bacterium]|nr:hypothetical protein [Anaerolineales bacterium]